jgi:hypothetical protein
LSFSLDGRFLAYPWRRVPQGIRPFDSNANLGT